MQSCLALALALFELAFLARAHASSDGLTFKLKKHEINASTLHPAMAFKSSIFGAHKAHLGVLPAWSTEIDVGFPPRKVEVLIDTGSWDLIVDHDWYNPSKSLTSKNLHKDWNTFGDGRAYTDEVRLGDVKIKDVVVGHVRKGGDFPFRDGFQGLMGISLPPNSFDTDKPTLTKAAVDQHAFKRNVWQLTLRHEGDSSLNIGKIDESEYEGELGWVDLDEGQDEWRLEIEINGYKAFGVVDSGGIGRMGAGVDRVKALFDRLPIRLTEVGPNDSSIEGWFDCDTLPDITFTAGGRELKYPKWLMKTDTTDNGTKCKFQVWGADDMTDWNFGDTIFLMASIVFDIDNRRVGFAPQRQK